MDNSTVVYIVEDENIFIEGLTSYVKNYLDMHDCKWEVITVSGDFDGALDDIDFSRQQNRIFFLDIVLGEANGLRLAQRIRDKDIRAYIIFVTSHLEYAFPAIQYKIRALDYILKSDDGLGIKISQCLDTIINEMTETKSEDKKQTILIRTNGTHFIIPLNEIVYFETNKAKRSIILHTNDKKIEFRDSLDELKQKLNDSFYRCHRSYIINLEHVQSVCRRRSDLHVLLDTGTKCLVSPRYLKGLVRYERNST